MELTKWVPKIVETINSHPPNVITIYLFDSHAKGEATPLYPTSTLQ